MKQHSPEIRACRIDLYCPSDSIPGSYERPHQWYVSQSYSGGPCRTDNVVLYNGNVLVAHSLATDLGMVHSRWDYLDPETKMMRTRESVSGIGHLWTLTLEALTNAMEHEQKRYIRNRREAAVVKRNIEVFEWMLDQMAKLEDPCSGCKCPPTACKDCAEHHHHERCIGCPVIERCRASGERC